MKKTTTTTKSTKTTKTPNNTSTAKKQLEKELSKIGLSVEGAKEWLNDSVTNNPCGQAGCPTCDVESMSDDEYISYLNNTADTDTSNVSFVPGATAEETLIYVGDTLLHGVTKASLEYDAELGVPVLKVEILGVSIG